MKTGFLGNGARALLAFSVCALSACSSFERDWRNASPTSGDPFSGKYEGCWTSAKQHGGKLRCAFSKQDESHYRASFHANWLAFASSYATTFKTERRGDVLHFRGAQNLGPLFGGEYRYEGQVVRGHFTARYDSSYDRGRFEMRKLGVATDCFPVHARD